ncbi:MAG: cation diffusion facilitator family transporter [Amphiplicatus sp.]
MPDAIKDDLRKAERLEWWTLFWLTSVCIVMAAAMGSSQAMRTALIEDVLSLLPAIVFLIAARWERKDPDHKFPFGYFRANSLAFLIAATALVSVGGFLLVHSGLSLIRAEHPTIAPIHLFGQDIWLGWPMIAALIYSVAPPVILGHLKLPVAKRINDKVLHTDALMQKADWTTGLAGVAGVLGIAFGLWWADAAAAVFISFEILRDGVRQLVIAAAELIDGVPRKLDSNDMADDAAALERALVGHFPGATIRLRETGRYIIAHVEGHPGPEPLQPLADYWPGDRAGAWRLAALSFEPKGSGTEPPTNG